MPIHPRSPSRPSLAALACIAALCAAPPCQTGVVHTGTSPAVVRLPSGWTRSLAAQPDGTLWCLAWESDGSGTATGRELLLFRSADEGVNWTEVTDVPTTGDGRGAIAVDRGCDLLHVAWHATDGGSYHNLYYQAFDTLTAQWVGSPDLLLPGTTPDDQYYANDIAVTAQGTVGIVFNTHRTPTISGFLAWSGGILARRPSDTAFQGPFRVNTDSYGMLGSMQCVGEVFHMSFRTNNGLYGIRYRAFDSATLQFLTNGDVPLYGANQGSMRSTNSSAIAADADGNLYVLYSVGPPNPAGGALEVAFSSPSTGYSTWTTSLVESDPSLTAGNVTYQHYSLARAENGSVFAVFAKASESFQNLYARILSPDPVTGGAAVVPDPATTPAVPLLVTTETESFQRVDGLRAEAAHATATIAFSGAPASQPGGQVGFLRPGTAARTLEWGVGCQGSLPALPRLVGRTLPAVGTTFDYGVVDAPANAAGIVFSGLDCLRPPFDLGTLGFTGCSVFFTPAASLFVVMDPAGAATVSIPIPGTLGGGFELQFGALLLAPGANPGGAVSTNALSASVN